MNSETKLTKSRDDLINLPEQLNNVTSAFKYMGTSSTVFTVFSSCMILVEKRLNERSAGLNQSPRTV